ncbi:MAG: ribonuclease R [Candidatus Paralactobacillus gallistercoris]|uniref:Ribonuclease R n=1 Tax=Candidatus Paralactobacillus gallistercoris TaxID=2838724 RepID=A0A948TJL0_9LACO|nr:ribonuclease R [Candidatus Paralactobacillus gallistercoris]
MLDLSQLRAMILSQIVLHEDQPHTVTALKQALDLRNTKDLMPILNEMIENGILSVEDGNFKLAQPANIVEGEFHANDRGFGFVNFDPEKKEKDIFIPPVATNYALDGDTVKTLITRQAKADDDRGAEGVIIAIISHKITRLVGEFVPFTAEKTRRTGKLGVITSHQKKLSKYSLLLDDTGIEPQQGDIVVAEITHYLSAQHPDMLRGIATQILGNKNEPGVDIMTIVEQHDITVDFSEEAMAQAEAIPDEVLPEEKVGRRDLTDQYVVTIDGDDSKDFDDAVNVWKMDNGHFHLGVHIADVSHYVTPGSPLDRDAYERGTSVYLTDRVIPMLPFKLSNGICSLNPHVERLALTCEMEIDQAGNVVAHDIFPSVIRSTERMTYNNVNKILEEHDPELEARYQKLLPMFHAMAELHEILANMRHARGAIDFEEDEAKIICDEEGHPIDIVLRHRGIAERMIESFMLAANETVAEHFYKMHVPFIYRVHETPDEEKLHDFIEFVSSFGVVVKHGKGPVKSKTLQDILTQVAGTPEEALVTTMALRSMKQAHYSDELLGHFGLAAKYYTHFTSPIRRYPDLFGHRMIHSYLEQGTSPEVKQTWQMQLPDVAEQSSTRERVAVDAERDNDDLKKAEFMADKVGQEFDAVVGSTTSFGMFVTLPNTVEGLVHISNMTDDYYDFVESQMALVGEHTKRTFRIGQPVKVKLDRVDVDAHEIDFSLVDPENAPTSDLGKLVDHSKRRRPMPSRNDNNKPRRNNRSGNKRRGKRPFNQIHIQHGQHQKH